jgi:hypothetical protein
MCTVLLPPGGYPIAVNKCINIMSVNASHGKWHDTKRTTQFTIICSWCLVNAQTCLYNTCYVTGWRHVLAVIEPNALVTFCTNGPPLYCALPHLAFTYADWRASLARARGHHAGAIRWQVRLRGKLLFAASFISWRQLGFYWVDLHET